MNNSSLLTMICIKGSTSIDPSQQTRAVETGAYNPAALLPLDGIRIIAEQVMYGMFVASTSLGNGYTDRNFFSQLLTQLNSFPSAIDTGNSAYDSLYASSYSLIRDLLRVALGGDFLNGSCAAYIRLGKVESYNILRSLFTTPRTKKAEENFNYNLYYTGSMTETFFLEWCSLFLDYFDAIKYPNGTLANGELYLPNVLMQKADEYVNIYTQPRDRMIIVLESKAVRNFNLNGIEVNPYTNPIVLAYLQHFDLKDYSPDDIVAFLASMCISHYQYDMTNADSSDYSTVLTALCFDLVTGSSYTADFAGLDRYKGGFASFVDWIKQLQQANGIQPIADYALFGDLLTRVGEDPAIVNYFVKPVNAISATESLTFRNSVYASLVRDRVFAGMEAADDTSSDDTTDTDAAPDDMPGEDTEDTETTLGDMPDEVDGTLDDGSDDSTAAQEKPPIDPDKMLLELASPSESMKDYIYRETVAKRISNILKNPPENARPNDLIMLKRWRSRWLYLASIACLRDFLTRLSLRLSDV